MNIFEIITDAFKSYTQSANTSLHVGEVMNLWTFLTATENFINSEEISGNKVEDKELKQKIDDLIENLHKPIIKELKGILLNAGVELPQPPVEKPLLHLEVPPGGRMTDEEVANFVVFNVVWAIKFCARGLTESVRADVGQLFAKAIIQKTAYSLTLKQLMADKGWLKIPPLHKPQQ